MNTGATIKELRLKKGWNQLKFAKMIDISSTSLSLIETGKTMPNKTNMQKICRILGVSEPLLVLLSITEADVPIEKIRVYRILRPMLDVLIKQLIL